jgi:hypothetical protein
MTPHLLRAGFTLPLYVLLGLELAMAGVLLLPLPLSRPAILLCKATKTDVGRSVFFTIFAILVVRGVGLLLFLEGTRSMFLL